MVPKKFRYKVAIWGKVKGLDELNETTYDDGIFANVWAEIVPQTKNLQRQLADTILVDVSHKIITRYRGDILPNMFIIYKGKRFDIKYILNPYERNETLEIFVTEVVT